jgi:hypothetical protein
MLVYTTWAFHVPSGGGTHESEYAGGMAYIGVEVGKRGLDPNGAFVRSMGYDTHCQCQCA